MIGWLEIKSLFGRSSVVSGEQIQANTTDLHSLNKHMSIYSKKLSKKPEELFISEGYKNFPTFERVMWLVERAPPHERKKIGDIKEKLIMNSAGSYGPFTGGKTDVVSSTTLNNFYRNRGGSRRVRERITHTVRRTGEKYGIDQLKREGDGHYMISPIDTDKLVLVMGEELWKRLLNLYDAESSTINGRRVLWEKTQLGKIIGVNGGIDLELKIAEFALKQFPKKLSDVDWPLYKDITKEFQDRLDESEEGKYKPGYPELNSVLRKISGQVKLPGGQKVDLNLPNILAHKISRWSLDMHDEMNKTAHLVKLDMLCRAFSDNGYYIPPKRGNVKRYQKRYVEHLLSTESLESLTNGFLLKYITFISGKVDYERYETIQGSDPDLTTKSYVDLQRRYNKNSLLEEAFNSTEKVNPLLKLANKLRRKGKNIDGRFSKEFVTKVADYMLEKIKKNPDKYCESEEELENIRADLEYTLYMLKSDQHSQIGDIRDLQEIIASNKKKQKGKINRILGLINKKGALPMITMTDSIATGQDSDELIQDGFDTTHADLDGSLFGDTDRISKSSGEYKGVPSGGTIMLNRTYNPLIGPTDNTKGDIHSISCFYFTRPNQVIIKGTEIDIGCEEGESHKEIKLESRVLLGLKRSVLKGFGVIPEESIFHSTFTDGKGEIYSANRVCDLEIEVKGCDLAKFKEKVDNMINKSFLSTNASLSYIEKGKIKVLNIGYENRLVNALKEEIKNIAYPNSKKNAPGLKVFVKETKARSFDNYQRHVKTTVDSILDDLRSNSQFKNNQNWKDPYSTECLVRENADKSLVRSYITAIIIDSMRSYRLRKLKELINVGSHLDNNTEKQKIDTFIKNQIIPEINLLSGEGMRTIIETAYVWDYGEIISNDFENRVNGMSPGAKAERKKKEADLARAGGSAVGRIEYFKSKNIDQYVESGSENFLTKSCFNPGLGTTASFWDSKTELIQQIVKGAAIFVNSAYGTTYRASQGKEGIQKDIWANLGTEIENLEIGRILLGLAAAEYSDKRIDNTVRRNIQRDITPGSVVAYINTSGEDPSEENKHKICDNCSTTAADKIIRSMMNGHRIIKGHVRGLNFSEYDINNSNPNVKLTEIERLEKDKRNYIAGLEHIDSIAKDSVLSNCLHVSIITKDNSVYAQPAFFFKK